jgi:small subunit ribosomal protein S6
LNLYEGMYIFPETMDEEAIGEALKTTGKEIEKLGGTVKSTARIGKRKFARQMKKQDYGYYVVTNFELDPAAVEKLRARFRLNEDLLRAQIVCAISEELSIPKPAAAEGEDNG